MQDLSGMWLFKTDKKNVGIAERWFLKELSENECYLPATTNENKIGKKLDQPPSFTKESIHSLREKYEYIGAMWYQKKIVIENFNPDSFYSINFERVLWKSDLWINDSYVSSCDFLSGEHEFDITNFIHKSGEYIVTVRIDNSDIYEINTTPSAYTEETQTIWNGAVGKCILVEKKYINCKYVSAIPQKSQNAVEIFLEGEVKNKQDNVVVEIEIVNNNCIVAEKKVRIPVKNSHDFKHKEIITLTNIMEWDEFQPNLYEVIIKFCYNNKNIFEEKKKIGFRELKREKNQLLINEHKLFLRGTIDCCVFPLTGYPPMEKEEWERILTKIKDYGLNHIRFHSWCPPEAAFDVADKLGLYLQIEGPIWLDNWMPFMLGDKKAHYYYFPKECIAILKRYGSHPSFCFFSCGNEIRGDFELLETIVEQLKQINSGIMYTLTSNWDRKLSGSDDFFIAQTVDSVPVRGQYFLDELVNGTMLNYDEAVKNFPAPIVSHEVGQYCVYPNTNEIEKYNGLLEPTNLISIRKDLIEKRMEDSVDKFVHSSGMLALQLYKDEIEAALRTDNFGGFQLLSLNDFPGQSTATVGVLDSFWDSKGLVRSSDFKHFCCELVPLIILEKRIFSTGETIEYQLEIANYKSQQLEGTLSIQLIKDTEILFTTERNVHLQEGLNKLGSGEIPIIQLEKNMSAKIIVTFSSNGGLYKNDWDIWFLRGDNSTKKDNIKIITHWDKEAIELAKAGNRILFLPRVQEVKQAQATNFFPVFWSPVHFASKLFCGGYINSNHPIFSQFPTNSYISYQWKRILENSFAFCIEKFETDPIVQMVPNFFNNAKMATLIETKIGNAKVVICSLDLYHSGIEGSSLLHSIIDYMSSKLFNPTNQLTFEQMIEFFYENKKDRTNDSRINLALNKIATADSEASTLTSANKGNDGLATTFWQAKDQENGHWWQVDLGEVKTIKEIYIEFNEKAKYQFTIASSLDGEIFTTELNRTDQVAEIQNAIELVDFNARYIRITYVASIGGVFAGHKEFKVFSE